MDATLQDFDDQWKSGDRAGAKATAEAYVAANLPDLETRFGGVGIPALVALLEDYRANDREDERILVDMWLIAKVAPQNIVGVGSNS